MRMAVFLSVTSLLVGACAGKPAGTPLPTTYVSTTGQPLGAAPVRADGTVDAQRLADAKKAGYSLVNTHGQLLYCRTDVKVGSHIPRNTDTVCLTAQEMDEIHEQTRHTLEQFVPFHMQCVPSNPRIPAPPC